MSIQATDILAVAQTLIEDKTEAAQRSAISRAYYAAFHATKAVVPTKFINPDSKHKPSSHEGLIDAVRTYSRSPEAKKSVTIKCSQEIAESLSRLKRYRTFADYNLGEEMINFPADRSLIDATKIINLCDLINKRANQ